MFSGLHANSTNRITDKLSHLYFPSNNELLPLIRYCPKNHHKTCYKRMEE